MTRLGFLLGEGTPASPSTPMEDRRDKKVCERKDVGKDGQKEGGRVTEKVSCQKYENEADVFSLQK
jgi:hypothetical protein